MNRIFQIKRILLRSVIAKIKIENRLLIKI